MKAHLKGELFYTPKGVGIASRTGSWIIEVEDHGDLDSQIENILKRLTNNLNSWKIITEQFKAEIFCGLFLKEWNEGLGLSAQTMKNLGDRGIHLDIDIYGPSDQ